MAPSCSAYGRRSSDKVWPWAMLRTVGRDVAEADPEEAVEAVDALARLLDELGPGTTFTSKEITSPLLKVMDTATGPRVWPAGTVACRRLPLSLIQSTLGND